MTPSASPWMRSITPRMRTGRAPRGRAFACRSRGRAGGGGGSRPANASTSRRRRCGRLTTPGSTCWTATPRAVGTTAPQNHYLGRTPGRVRGWHLGAHGRAPTTGRRPGTRASSATSARIHRTGHIACVYRAVVVPQGRRARRPRPPPSPRRHGRPDRLTRPERRCRRLTAGDATAPATRPRPAARAARRRPGRARAAGARRGAPASAP